jgi:hypothetical protein
MIWSLPVTHWCHVCTDIIKLDVARVRQLLDAKVNVCGKTSMTVLGLLHQTRLACVHTVLDPTRALRKLMFTCHCLLLALEEHLGLEWVVMAYPETLALGQDFSYY